MTSFTFVLTHESIVHGLTTAASLWLSAAVGVACGGTLYFAATFGSALMLALLRFGPRFSRDEEEEEDSEEDAADPTETGDEEAAGYGGVESPEKGATEQSNLLQNRSNSERDVRRESRPSMRKRAHLGSIV